MTQTTYQLQTPEWLWQVYTTVIKDHSEYSRYNDSLLAAIALDVQRFDELGLCDLGDEQRTRLESLIDEVDPVEAVPELDALEQAENEAREPARSTFEPRGERR